MTTVLGISPGTRLTGLALLRDGELTDWRVKTFKGPWSESKLRDIVFALKTYIDDTGVSVVALKKPDVFRTSNGLERLISELKAFCQRSRIPVTMFSLKTLKDRCSKEKGFTKAKMIKQVASQFPELYSEYNKELRSRNEYYTKMFEAITVALNSSYPLI